MLCQAGVSVFIAKFILSLLFREFCLQPEDKTDDVLVSEPVKDEQKGDAEDVSEGVMDDSIHAERVEDEKDENKKYLKTNRVCQFFNIC